MPFKDGTGPLKAGAGFGCGRGGCGTGIGGECICVNCGKRVSHQRGVPCSSFTCPKCGSRMTRK
jgi:hypothetical protein